MTRVAHQNQRHMCVMHRGHSYTHVSYDSVTEVLPLENTITPVLRTYDCYAGITPREHAYTPRGRGYTRVTHV